MTGGPEREPAIRRFALAWASLMVLLAFIPWLLSSSFAPAGSTVLGYTYNTDDQMVYAAWMTQAKDGNWLLENRFTTDPQPGMTVHVYFWALGQLSKAVGVLAAEQIARAAFTFLFVLALSRLVLRLKLDIFTSKLAIVLGTLGGGIGFLVWHDFGRELVRPSAQLLAPLLSGLQPVDVWQTEGFVFPSMLTTSLFMASLCLVLVAMVSALESREGWKGVPAGAMAVGLLMNIHSYDILLLALVWVAFLAVSIVKKHFNPGWLGRMLVVTAGALPGAWWFTKVLQADPVFQSRAATPTYSANFRPFLAGYAPLIGFAAVSFKKLPALLLGLMLGVGFALAGPAKEAFWMPWAVWALAFLAAVVLVVMLGSDEDPAWNLAMAWGIIGLVAPYIPFLFQRKLSAGLVIPWAILGAVGIAAMLKKLERGQRNLVAAVAVVGLSATSVLWLQREIRFLRDNVSRTTVHAAFLSKDATEIVRFIEREGPKRAVVIAPPGAASPGNGPDAFGTPLLTDLNPIVTGLAGAVSYAGHWSETPDYTARRSEIMPLFFSTAPEAEALAVLEKVKPDYVIGLNPEAFPNEPVRDLSGLGEVVYRGSTYVLVRPRR